MVIAPNGKKAYITNADGWVTPIDLATDTAGRRIMIGGEPGAIAITPNGRTAYIANLNGSVEPVDLASGTSSSPIWPAHQGLLSAIAITPSGKTAYVVASGTVTSINLDTGIPGAPIAVGGIAIAITPNGKAAYILKLITGTVTPINLATGALRSPITVPGGSAYAIAITR
jgi:DNA-binding beta-propeller fold protein YncE